jgi:hypothetical protein
VKAILCSNCGTIDGLRADERHVCGCGGVHGRWADPRRGLALIMEPIPGSRVARRQPWASWVLGIHNGFLFTNPPDYRAWDDGGEHLFSRSQSSIVRVRPGTSSDTLLVPPAVFDTGEWPTMPDLAAAWEAMLA